MIWQQCNNKEKILIREIQTTQINQMKITERKNIISEIIK